MEENKLAIFEGKRIRRTIHNNEWWFSIIDVIEVLTDSSIPKRYWSNLKRKLVKKGGAVAERTRSAPVKRLFQAKKLRD